MFKKIAASRRISNKDESLLFFDQAVVIVFKSCRVVVPLLIKTSYWHCNLAPLRSKTFRKNLHDSEGITNRDDSGGRQQKAFKRRRKLARSGTGLLFIDGERRTGSLVKPGSSDPAAAGVEITRLNLAFGS